MRLHSTKIGNRSAGAFCDLFHSTVFDELRFRIILRSPLLLWHVKRFLCHRDPLLTFNATPEKLPGFIGPNSVIIWSNLIRRSPCVATAESPFPTVTFWASTRSSILVLSLSATAFQTKFIICQLAWHFSLSHYPAPSVRCLRRQCGFAENFTAN
jgi:hypothetical protein